MPLNPSGFTREQSTEDLYRQRVTLMLMTFKAETGQSWKDDVVACAEWVAAKRPTISASYWRFLRAAFIWFWDQKGALDAVAILRTAPDVPQSSFPLRTSAKKLKRLSENDLLLIKEYANESGRSGDRFVYLWLAAGIITGLRPCEWESARFDPSRAALHLANAKATNGRAAGETRSLLFRSKRSAECRLVQEFLSALFERLGSSTFDQVYTSARNRLHYIGKMLWPGRRKRPTLYSGRHQAAANAKSAGFTKAEVAAIMGHASELTAGTHYARRSLGGGKTAVSPDPSVVQRVSNKQERLPGID